MPHADEGTTHKSVEKPVHFACPDVTLHGDSLWIIPVCPVGIVVDNR
jgi:hypothetical protein